MNDAIARIDARFDRVEVRLERLEARMDDLVRQFSDLGWRMTGMFIAQFIALMAVVVFR